MAPGLTTTLTQATITPGSAYSAVATLVFGDGSTSLASAPSTTFAIGRLADCLSTLGWERVADLPYGAAGETPVHTLLLFRKR